MNYGFYTTSTKYLDNRSLTKYAIYQTILFQELQSMETNIWLLLQANPESYHKQNCEMTWLITLHDSLTDSIYPRLATLPSLNK